MKPVITAHESSEITVDFSGEEIKEFNRCFDENDPTFLGIHQEFEDYQVKLKSHFFVGYRWLDKTKESFIHIKPKKVLKNKQVDYINMLLECLQDPVVSKDLGSTYEIFFKEKWIEIEDKNDEVSPFIVLQFLQLLDKIKIKGLKKGYMKTTSNLTSKIQGKILINQTIKSNHLKNRMDKTVCSHEVFTEDCLENQILKTALVHCSRYVGKTTNKEVLRLLKNNLNYFSHISTKKVLESDFKKIKNSAFYKEYKEGLRLAKMIFKRFGLTLDDISQSKKSRTPPFYINMEELFKKYAQVKLRKRYKEVLAPNPKELKDSSNPDFLIKDQKLMVNTNYGFWVEEGDQKEQYQNDTLLGRSGSVKQSLGVKKYEEVNILSIYPSIYGYKTISENYNTIDDLSNLYRFGVFIPIKEIS